jgi:hypothetical protein
MTDEQITLLTKLQGVFKDKGLVDHNIIDGEVLIIPLAIDPVNPERGLWGMIDWERWSVSEYNTVGYLRLKNSITKTVHIYAPYTALLKALVEQEGV